SAVELVRVRARRAEDRPAAWEEPRDLPRPERREDPVDEPAPALPDADHLPAAGERAPPDRADDRVQAGAVAAPGEDADPHRDVILRVGRLRAPRRRGQTPTEGAEAAARGQRLHDFAVVKPVWACNVAEPGRILPPTMGRKPARTQTRDRGGSVSRRLTLGAVAAIAVILALVAAGCGGSKKSSSTTTSGGGGTGGGGSATALPASACSPIYYEGSGKPQYIIASDLPLQGSGRTQTVQMTEA